MTESFLFGKIISTLFPGRSLEVAMSAIIRKIACAGLVLVPLLVVIGSRGLSLAQQRLPPAISPAPRGADNEPAPSKGPSRNLKMMKESFEQTQKDTAELYDLATQLKEEVEKADENTLSLTVMKKAEAVEKLAGKIKNRMKNM
jgi:hypothetical protein